MHDSSEGLGSIERQLGEVVGTVRMAVSAVETLRETVEKLAERAAFRADLEVLRAETTRALEETKTSASAKVKDLGDKLETLRASHADTQRLMWMALGGLAVVTSLINFFRPALTKFFGV